MEFLGRLVVYHSKFNKDIEKLSTKDKTFINKKLKLILNNEEPSNIKKLKDYNYADLRIRVGNFRILCRFHLKSHIVFLRCMARKNLY